MSKKNKLIARIGNFELTKDHGAEHSFIRLNAVGGSWGVSFRDDNPMYGLWSIMAADHEYAHGMEILVTMMYTLSNSLLDAGFVRDYFNALEAMSKRKVDALGEPTEKESAEAAYEAELLQRRLSDG